jgi:hypothetical protein
MNKGDRRFASSGITVAQDLSWHVAICDPKLTIYNCFLGVLAQLVERLNGIEEVTGSNPVGSIFFLHITAASQRLRPCADQLKTIPTCAVTNP